MTLLKDFFYCGIIAYLGIYLAFGGRSLSLANTLAGATLLYVPYLGLAAVGGLARKLRKPRAGGGPLDKVLFHWTADDPFTVRHLCESCAIFGRIGAGKSSASGLLLARAIVGLARSGGLWLVSKPEDRNFVIKRFQEAGRMDDLIIFGPNEPARCNFIDFEMQSGGDSRSLTQFLMVTSEGLDGESGHGGENAQFFKQGKKRLIYCTIEACRQGGVELTVPNFHQFIATAAYSVAQFSNEVPAGQKESPLATFQKGFHFKTMDAAALSAKTEIEQHDFTLVKDYWLKEFINMDNKVRSSILADVLNVLFTYNIGIVRQTVSTTTTVSPEVMAQGKWVMVDFPLDQYGDSGKIIMHGWKFLTQKFILRRHVKPDDSVIVIHADEAQEMVSSYDGAFLAKCRSHYGAMIYLTQSFHSYTGGMDGKKSEHKAKELLTNFVTRIFHTLGDSETAEFASSLLGKRRERFVDWTPEKSESAGQEMFATTGGSGRLSESYQPILQPTVFMSGLRCGGEPECVVDGIVIRSGEPFSNGENWLRIAFSQK